MKKFSSSCSKSNGSAVKRFAEILLIVVALVAAFALFAACNGGSGSAPSTDGGTGSAGQTTVGQIYLESGVSLDRQALLENETQEIAVFAFGEGSTVVSFGIEQGALSVISLNGGALSSVVVSLPEEVVDILNDELSSVLLKEANLTQNQTVSASEKEQVKQKLFEASQSVQSQIGEVSSLTYGTQNSYITGSVRQNGSGSVSVLGAVRSDGSVLLFDVLSDGKLSQSVFKIENAQSMTEDELWQAVTDGSLQPASQSDIDLSAVYAPPAVEEKITIGEIFDQNFANIDLSAELEKAFQKIYSTGYTSSTAETKFYAVNENTNELSLYFELTRNRNGALSFNELKFLVPASIAQINGDMEDYILGLAGYSSQDEIETSKETQALDAIQTVVDLILDDIAAVGNTELSNLSSRTIINHNEEITNPNTFGEALLEDMGEQGDIIATYVGDMSGKGFDTENLFGTGYLCEFQVTVVYSDGNQVMIVSTEVVVPWYTDSTDQSLYSEFISQDGQYLLRNTETITIANPVFVDTTSVF